MSNVPAELPRDISLCLYRIVQECLSNAIRHSGAKEANVELVVTGHQLRLCVTDSGTGFDSASPGLKKGLGLVSMKERLRLVGGNISIHSQPSNGTYIEAGVPLARIGVERNHPSADDTMSATGAWAKPA